MRKRKKSKKWNFYFNGREATVVVYDRYTDYHKLMIIPANKCWNDFTELEHSPFSKEWQKEIVEAVKDSLNWWKEED